MLRLSLHKTQHQPRGLICMVVVIAMVVASLAHPKNKDDPHGGVPMGIPNSFCDDGHNYISIDWDPSSTDEYTCNEHRDSGLLRSSYEQCEEKEKQPIHVCYPEEIEYDEDLPTSGRHRPLWPKYGEYRYLPVQRWLHSLEHGAIVFLYNPCANETQISELKALARRCLRRHIISPSKRIPKPNMFAVLSWMCKLVMTHVDVPKTVDFIKRTALDAPEKSVYSDGQYSKGLIHHAKMVSDYGETELCPQMSMLAESAKWISARSRYRVRELKKQKARNINSIL